MSDILQIMPVTKVKRGLLDILKTMQEEDSTITLTRNGEAVGVMMTPDRYEALLETIEILADKEVLGRASIICPGFSGQVTFIPTKRSGAIDGRIPPALFGNLQKPNFKITPRIKIHHSIKTGRNSRRTVFRKKTGERVVGLSFSSGKKISNYL